MNKLFLKYNVPGPRYTSYPTVPYWEATPSEEIWFEHLKKALDEAKGKKIGGALYIHIPFCESMCSYCGCNTRITRNHSVGLPYIQTVLEEWTTYIESIQNFPLAELHLGGGTPTFLSPSELETLMDGILKYCSLLEDAEFSIEVDPRVTTIDHLKKLSGLNFRRLSMGVQDFDPHVQEVVHRIQSEEKVSFILNSARSLGFESINYDLIYGLPFQTQESIRKTMAIVCAHKPDRIAFYAYAHVPWIKPGQRRFTEDDLPNGEEKRALYETGRHLLEQAGYIEIGMDHFALKTDTLYIASQNQTLHRNFMGYIPKRVSPLIGLGVSAISDSWTAFSQNEKILEKYSERVKNHSLPILRGHILNNEDLILRRHILNIMTNLSTEWEGQAHYTGYLDEVPERLSELSYDGLVKLTKNSISVTPEGRAFLRNICMAFDARLSRQAPNTTLFSKTI